LFHHGTIVTMTPRQAQAKVSIIRNWLNVQLGCFISAISEKSSTNMPILIEAI
jgi:hypothetical protein